MNKRPKGKIPVQKEKPLETERRPIELMNMDLSCRVFNRLVAAKLDTVEKIDSVTGDYLISLRNFGVSALEELNRELKKYGWPEKVVEDYGLQQRMKEQKKIQAVNQRVLGARQTKKAMATEELEKAQKLLLQVYHGMTIEYASEKLRSGIIQYLTENKLI